MGRDATHLVTCHPRSCKAITQKEMDIADGNVAIAFATQTLLDHHLQVPMVLAPRGSVQMPAPLSVYRDSDQGWMIVGNPPNAVALLLWDRRFKNVKRIGVLPKNTAPANYVPFSKEFVANRAFKDPMFP